MMNSVALGSVYADAGCINKISWQPEPKRWKAAQSSPPSRLQFAKAKVHNSMGTVRIGVLGATGYKGAEILGLLAKHPHLHITMMTSERNAGQYIGSVIRHLATQDLPKMVAIKDADFSDVDAVFCCLPDGTTQKIIKDLPKELKIVDLSADFRLRNIDQYEEWYGKPHKAPELQKEAIYGLTEVFREEIQNARLVANPGCYPTSIHLPLIPLMKGNLIEPKTIIIDAVCSVGAAGIGAKEAHLYSEVSEGIHTLVAKPHQHVPEIEQGLSDASRSKVTVSFIPHLVHTIRGMHSTSHVEMSPGVTIDDLHQHLHRTYEGEEFVKLLEKGTERAHIAHVWGSNYCFMQVSADGIPGRAKIFSVIDNLMKGATGQALQNLNLMLGYPENLGLNFQPFFPSHRQS